MRGGAAAALVLLLGVRTAEACSPTTPILSAKTTRYWDCCKPSCSWSSNSPDTDKPVTTCGIDGKPLTNYDTKNVCSGGGSAGPIAYMCHYQMPWEVSSDLAFGFAAANLECGTCYELTFTSSSLSQAGKRMIVQVTNRGDDLGQTHFDIQLPGGGFGIFNGCAAQGGQQCPNGDCQFQEAYSAWGARYGGLTSLAQCAGLPVALQAGCEFRFGWFENADNPTANARRVKCPAEIIQLSGSRRTDDNSYCDVSGGGGTAPPIASLPPQVPATLPPTTQAVANCPVNNPSTCDCSWTAGGQNCVTDDGSDCWCQCCCPHNGGTCINLPPPPATQPPTVSTQPPTGATQPPTVATEHPTASTEPPTTATEPPTVATQPPTASTKPPTAATQPPTVATQPPTMATEPPTGATQPPTAATQPPTVATQPPTVSTEPPTTATEPPTGATQPPTGATQPPTGATQPPTVETEPPTVATQPPTGATQPPTVATEPPTVSTKPPTKATEPPTVATEPPTDATLPPSDTSVCSLQEWKACAGQTWQGGCCKPGLVCYRQHQWFSQCRQPGTCPSDWDCSVGGPGAPTAPPTANYCTVADWGSCSPTNCCAGENFDCVRENRRKSQCRPVGDCPKGWRCNKVKHMTRGEACGCSGYRGDGVTDTSKVLCKMHKAGADGKRWCEAPDAHGECEARTHSACGEKVRLSLLVNAAKSDILSGSLTNALTKAMRIEANKLVMEWICPDSVCDPECPTTNMWKTLRGCLKVVNKGQIRSRQATGLEKAERYVVTASFTEDATTEFEEDKMSELGRQVDLISGGVVFPAAKDLAPYIVKGESSLEVSAEPIEDRDFDVTDDTDSAEPVRESPPQTASEDDGSLSLPILVGSIAGALALCGGVGLVIVRRRSSSASYAAEAAQLGEDAVELPQSVGRTKVEFAEITDSETSRRSVQPGRICRI